MLALAWYLRVYTVADIEPAPAIRSLAVITASALIVTSIAIRLLGRERGSAVAAIIVAALVTANGSVRALPFVLAIALIVIERSWAKRGRINVPWPRIHDALTLIVGIMLVIQVWQVATVSGPEPMIASDAWAAEPLNNDPRPDIYMILADAHGREDVLSSGYHYDDRPFLDSLRSAGLVVAPSSHANYLFTRFSVASLLSASYLEPLNRLAKLGQDAFAQSTIHQNPAFPLLRRAGYDVTVLSGGYEHLGLRSADKFVDSGEINEFEMALLQNSTVGQLLDVVAPDMRFAAVRDRVNDEFEDLLEIAGSPSVRPTFVFVHLPVPHYPFAFDATCGPSQAKSDPVLWQDNGPGGAATDAALVAQTRCVDRRLSDTVTELVRRDPDAVVVVFSDHGPDQHLNWASPDPTGTDERTATLFAARTPGHPGLFPDDIGLINVVPTLFNTYLGTRLPLEPSEVWFGPRPQDDQFVLEDDG